MFHKNIIERKLQWEISFLIPQQNIKYVSGRYAYLGCYFDEHPARRLISDYKDFGKHLTHETCINYCKDKGYLYAGLQYG